MSERGQKPRQLTGLQDGSIEVRLMVTSLAVDASNIGVARRGARSLIRGASTQAAAKHRALAKRYNNCESFILKGRPDYAQKPSASCDSTQTYMYTCTSIYV